jgi:epoxyqueuosine reductase
MPESLTDRIKRVARQFGAVKVGIASREDLAGPPEADMSYVMPEARTAVMYYVVLDEELIQKWLGKQDSWLYRNHFFENLQRLGDIGVGVAEALRERGFKAEPQSPNGVYRPGSNLVKGLVPPFSLRYGAVAAGLGNIGRSGVMMTPEYGARVQLGGVITEADLEPDSPMEENPCDDCMICVKSCPTGFMSAKETVTFALGGREITHAKKAVHARCAISCGGLTGLSASGKWSTWSSGRWEIPKDDRELLENVVRPKLREISASYGGRGFFGFSRLLKIEGYKQPGILVRAREDTLVTCGNCSIICLETPEKRKELWRLLTRSGVVVEGEDGQPVAMTANEAQQCLAAQRPAAAASAVAGRAASGGSS